MIYRIVAETINVLIQIQFVHIRRTKTREVDPIASLLRSLLWRLAFYILLLVYESLKGLWPEWFLAFVNRPDPSVGLGLVHFLVQESELNMEKQHSGPHIWNKVPESCRSAETLRDLLRDPQRLPQTPSETPLEIPSERPPQRPL